MDSSTPKPIPPLNVANRQQLHAETTQHDHHASRADHSWERDPAMHRPRANGNHTDSEHDGQGMTDGLTTDERHAPASSSLGIGSSHGSLTLSITPPRFMPPSSFGAGGDTTDHANAGSVDSFGSFSHSGQGPVFNLSTGSLNFHPSTSSVTSPTSPSYSTIAVARARAAAATASVEGTGKTVPGQGDATDPTFSTTKQSMDRRPSLGDAHSPLSAASSGMAVPSSLTSSSSSLLSSSGSSMPLTHLQDNAKAEREVSMILPNFLFLGGELLKEEQLDELEKLGIRRVLNMAENCNDELVLNRWGGQGYLKVGLRDHVDQDLREGLDKAIGFIASEDTPIYVHCQAGKSRSVATVIGYLIQEHHWPLKKAYDHVVERRRCMSPNIGFVSQLIMLEERVLGPERAGGLVSVGSAEDVDPTSRTTVVPWANA